MPENNRRYTDKGTEVDPVKDALGTLKRRLTEGEDFDLRKTDSEKFNDQVGVASKEFALKAASVVEPQEAQIKPVDHQKSGLTILLSKSPHSPEHKKYIENSVEKALSSARKSFENAGITLPTDNEILQQMVMTNRFRPEQIEALIRNIQIPGLIIMPPQMQEFNDYREFLNKNKKRRGQNDVFVSDSRRKAFASQEEKLQKDSALYRFGVGELAQELEDKSGKLKNIVTKWQKSDLAKILRVSTPREYAVLQAQASDLLDLKGWSILCEENEPHNIIGDDGLVSGGRGSGGWDGDAGVNFNDSNPEDDFFYARVRPVVVG